MILCPLCLQDIRPPAEFFLYCRQHPAADPAIRYDGHRNDLERLRCHRDATCNRPQQLWGGVFLAHRDCPVKNPFWDGARVVVRGRRTFESQSGELVPVEDPQLDLLEELSAKFPDRPEMWFPQGLFRAINESQDFGRLVMLAGPRQVGKTIISTMAMNPDSYESDAMSAFEPQTFMSLQALTGSVAALESYLAAIHAASQLRVRRPASAFVAPTGREEAHLKAVFLASSRRKGALAEIGHVFRGIGEMAFKDAPSPEKGAIHPVIAFFDFAGERFSHLKSYALETLARKMHVIAVVMEAPDLTLFGRRAGGSDTEEDPDSVRRACERLAMAPSGPRTCLVVTKLDLVDPALRGEEANRYLDSLAAREDGKLGGQARNILTSWLDPGVYSEKKLAATLKNNRDLPVFFVRTLHLDGHMLGANGNMPHSIGLQQFLLWVLDWLPRR